MDSNNTPELPSEPSRNNAHWILISIIVGVICLTVVNKYRETREPDTPAIIWMEDYTAGLDQARQEDKPILLAFHASWCPPCNKMKRTTYHDPAAIKAVENMVCIMISYDGQKDLVRQYNVNGIPNYVVLTPQGVISNQFSGYRTASDFIRQLK